MLDRSAWGSYTIYVVPSASLKHWTDAFVSQMFPISNTRLILHDLLSYMILKHSEDPGFKDSLICTFSPTEKQRTIIGYQQMQVFTRTTAQGYEQIFMGISFFLSDSVYKLQVALHI